jgi:tetratricopeptide (TPR) repeat protein
MSLLPAIRLVQSLSGPEKRFFKLNTRQQSGPRDYQELFDIICNSEPYAEKVSIQFKAAFPNSNIDNTSRYLMRVLTDCLIQSRVQKDGVFQLFQGIMRVKVLQERALPEEGYKELKRIRENASQHQQHFIEYLTYRFELDHLSGNGFSGVSDSQLVQTQMKARELLKNVNHVQDHHSLFELMKYRLLHAGQILSDEHRKKLNDLMLSEMILMTGKMKNNFAAQKLHLLFQSYFLTNIGDFPSALKTYRELNKLFEDNLSLLDHPPLDYLSALDGIITSLCMLKQYDEIDYYSAKLEQLSQQPYPEYFRYQLRKSTLAASLAILTAKGQYESARQLLNQSGKDLLASYGMVNEEKQWELYFYAALSHFGCGDIKKAHKWLGEVMQLHKPQPTLLICKAARLLNLIIHFESGDTEYIDYEIRSYSRFFHRPQAPRLQTEILLLKLLQSVPAHSKRFALPASIKKQLSKIDQLQNDKYEQQLLRYFDFSEWMKKIIRR